MLDEKAKKRAARKAGRKARRKHRLGDWPPELQAVATYEFGQSREVLAALKARVTQALRDPADKRRMAAGLTEFLASKATLAGKRFACRQLAIAGSAENVPGIAALLTNPETADMARYALEPIPGPEVDEALLKALSKTSGTVKVGIINSLGQRKARSAVGVLGKLANSGDEQVSGAAMAALASITR